MRKTYYCWRCPTPVPMLSEEEWHEIVPLLHKDIKYIKDHRTKTQISLREALDTLQFEACKKYFEITGFHEADPNTIWHRRLSDYGPECSNCSYLLRTNKASFCANCGLRINLEQKMENKIE